MPKLARAIKAYRVDRDYKELGIFDLPEGTVYTVMAEGDCPDSHPPVQCTYFTTENMSLYRMVTNALKGATVEGS